MARDQQPPPSPGSPQKSRVIAGLLGIVLGAFGAHRFYLGNNGVGLLQAIAFVLLVVPTFGAVALWGIIEGIMILCRSKSFERDARGVPLA